MYIVSATSLMASGCSVDQKFLLAAYWSHVGQEKIEAGKDTETNVWKVVLWDMDALWSGMHPTTNWEGNDWPENSPEATLAGTPLADGYCALPWVLKGDLEYFASVLGLEHWANQDKPCVACKVNRGQNPRTDHIRIGALDLQWTPLEWIQAKGPLHPLWRWGGIGHWSLASDIMHVVSVGVGQHIAGNVLFEMLWWGHMNKDLQRSGNASRNIAN